MSWKIYEAYKWNGSLEELYAHLFKMRKEFMAFGKSYLAALNKAQWFAQIPADEKYKVVKAKDILTEEMEKEFHKGRWHPLNIDASVVVYYFEGQLYIQYFGVGDCINLAKIMKLSPLSKEHPALAEFHYQNQTDQPEDVSEKDWEERERIWRGIFQDSGRPSDSGLTFGLIDCKDIFELVWSLDFPELRDEQTKAV